MIGYKLYHIDKEGNLLTPYRKRLVTSPIQRAKHFDPTETHVAAGVHAVLYGHGAVPNYSLLAWAQVRILPGAKAVVSPWAFRAEAVILEKITFRQSYNLDAPELQAAYDRWRRWCDVEMKPYNQNIFKGLVVVDSYTCPRIYYTTDKGEGTAEVHYLNWRTPSRFIETKVNMAAWLFAFQEGTKTTHYIVPCGTKNPPEAKIAHDILRKHVPAVLADNFCQFLAGMETG